MSPIAEPVVLDLRAYNLRLVGPKSVVFPDTPGRTFTVLNRSDLVARPLPSSNLPTSSDFVSGQWNGRMYDAGDAKLVFPNKEASDGASWRGRFDPTNKLQWIEVTVDEYLEMVICVTKVTPDRNQVLVEGYDGFQMCKNAYVRDWTCVQAPRDVIERGTGLWVPITVDDFSYQGTSVPSSQWTTSSVTTTGAIRCGTGANDAGVGTQAWASPGNIASGSSAATFAVTGPQGAGTFVFSQGLRASNFGFAIPGGATIVGLQVTIVSESQQAGIGGGLGQNTSAVNLVVGGAVTAFRPTVGGAWINLTPAGPQTIVDGSSTDLWSTAGALTPAVANASNFGIEVSGSIGVYGTGTCTFLVYSIALTIYYTSTSGVVASIRTTGGLNLSVPAVNTDQVSLTGPAIPCTSPIWFADVAAFQIPPTSCYFYIQVFENPGSASVPAPAAQINIFNGIAYFYVYTEAGPSGQATLLMGQVTPAVAPSYDLRIESDGEWLWGFINGQLIGCGRRGVANPTSLQVSINLLSTGAAGNVIVSSVALEALQPFLMRSAAQRQNPSVYGGTAANVAAGGTHWPWSTPSGAVTPPNGQALSNKNTVGTGWSDGLFVVNFGFNIPANATITGLKLAILRENDNASNASVTDKTIQLVTGGVGGSPIGNNLATAVAWPLGAAWATYGSVREGWGAGLTPAIANDPGFGAMVQCNFNTNLLSCDAIVFYPVQMTIYYTQPTLDSGDYVLPGDATTYPWGGLHARYHNNLDLAGDSNRLLKIMSPIRTQAFAGSGVSGEYANQQDVTINDQQNPLPGAATTSWSCLWFGSIYLKLSAGDYIIKLFQPGASAASAVRVWIGKTKFGDQIIDSWSFTTTAVINTVTLPAASLAGTNSDGTTTIRDGWYPIKIEYAMDNVGGAGATAPALHFAPPVTYTDPGGTSLTGSTDVLVPATSLSPLGMVDNRYQGISHFDLAQKTAINFGYQFTVEPKQLESGLFPGVLAPRIREGHDVDLVLEPDDTQRKEGMINYSSVLDGTDQASSLQGNGAGFQNGTTGQLQANVYDVPTLQNALFDMQGWQDVADVSYVSLLDGVLNSELSLRLAPWSLITGDPTGRQRQAGTWPLPGALSQMRWRPGDGVRVLARDINIQDQTPRQLLLVTRNIHPNGITSTQVGFAARPKSHSYSNRRALAAALRPQRNYQKQLVSITGFPCEGTIAGGVNTQFVPNSGWAPYTGAFLSPGDTLVRARMRIAMTTGTTPLLGMEVWGGGVWSDVTSVVGGPWTASLNAPINIDVTSVALVSTDNRMLFIIINKSANAVGQIDFQAFIDVLR